MIIDRTPACADTPIFYPATLSPIAAINRAALSKSPTAGSGRPRRRAARELFKCAKLDIRPAYASARARASSIRIVSGIAGETREKAEPPLVYATRKRNATEPCSSTALIRESILASDLTNVR